MNKKNNKKNLQPQVKEPVVRSTGTDSIINSQPNGGVEGAFILFV